MSESELFRPDSFGFAGNLALNSIEGVVNYHDPVVGVKTMVLVPKTPASIGMWSQYMAVLQTNDAYTAHKNGDDKTREWVQSSAFSYHQTKSHFVIVTEKLNDDLQWSGIVSAYAQGHGKIIEINEKGDMSPDEVFSKLESFSQEIENDKARKRN